LLLVILSLRGIEGRDGESGGGCRSRSRRSCGVLVFYRIYTELDDLL
jgi:hypothetical protein